MFCLQIGSAAATYSARVVSARSRGGGTQDGKRDETDQHRAPRPRHPRPSWISRRLSLPPARSIESKESRSRARPLPATRQLSDELGAGQRHVFGTGEGDNERAGPASRAGGALLEGAAAAEGGGRTEAGRAQRAVEDEGLRRGEGEGEAVDGDLAFALLTGGEVAGRVGAVGCRREERRSERRFPAGGEGGDLGPAGAGEGMAGAAAAWRAGGRRGTARGAEQADDALGVVDVGRGVAALALEVDFSAKDAGDEGGARAVAAARARGAARGVEVDRDAAEVGEVGAQAGRADLAAGDVGGDRGAEGARAVGGAAAAGRGAAAGGGAGTKNAEKDGGFGPLDDDLIALAGEKAEAGQGRARRGGRGGVGAHAQQGSGVKRWGDWEVPGSGGSDGSPTALAGSRATVATARTRALQSAVASPDERARALRLRGALGWRLT